MHFVAVAYNFVNRKKCLREFVRIYYTREYEIIRRTFCSVFLYLEISNIWDILRHNLRAFINPNVFLFWIHLHPRKSGREPIFAFATRMHAGARCGVLSTIDVRRVAGYWYRYTRRPGNARRYIRVASHLPDAFCFRIVVRAIARESRQLYMKPLLLAHLSIMQ